ncbi:MAG: 16S rRNA (cytidine(1402)-2'-O)-methyltransferase [bacterium]
MKTFYVIATPIGNLEDITLRALRLFKEVDLVLCEDTRVTGKLLAKYEIKTSTMSYHAHSKIQKIDKIIEMIEDDKTLALVSDAGTPTISDPGSLLVSKLREHFGESLKIVAVPGPSALVSALSISGLSSDEFTFLGFLPHKKGRETLFKEIAESKRVVVFYESPHRILKALEKMISIFPDRRIVIAREITKIFEEVISGTPKDVQDYFLSNPSKVKGEFVVMVGA